MVLALPKYTSSPKPRNTKATPTHCLVNKTLPKMTTEASKVKNLRVVVMMEQVRGPKLVMVVKMKICPTALDSPNIAILYSTSGCLTMNPTASTPSPVARRPGGGAHIQYEPSLHTVYILYMQMLPWTHCCHGKLVTYYITILLKAPH